MVCLILLQQPYVYILVSGLRQKQKKRDEWRHTSKNIFAHSDFVAKCYDFSTTT